ncbi:MAG: hypothetical protein P4L22_01695 [Candidatus Babeliales bacterium]|nr:hypothetical protein [Candidatus Babeliales bacterium]
MNSTTPRLRRTGKLIILIFALIAFNTNIEANRGYASGNFNRGYSNRNNRNQRWSNNPYGWGNRNRWNSNYWNNNYRPYPIFNTWPYDEYSYVYDDYYDDCYYYPQSCQFGFFWGY